MVHIISRAQWGARPARSRVTTSWNARTGFTVHYSAGPATQTPRQIQDFHMDGRGWSDVGYNFMVDVLGRAYEGRGWLVVGAHAAPHNTSHIGVCFLGRDGDATPAAKNTIRALYDESVRRKGAALTRTGHGGLSGNSTSCPGTDLREWVRAGMPMLGGPEPAPPEPPRVPLPVAPVFPLPRGHWFGPESRDSRNHSGFWVADRPHISAIRNQLIVRGWRGVDRGERYDAALASTIRAFQTEAVREGHSTGGVDGLVGARTWPLLWSKPIT